VAVSVVVDDDAVDITLSGWDALWALRRRLHLPMADIVAARVAPVEEPRRELGLRLGGTAWPGSVLAGHYATRGHLREGWRQFWSVYRDREVLVIDTRLPRPRRVVLQHPDRHDLAWWIGERLGRRDERHGDG